jgi:mannose-1-phosphate guanylyltransferase
VDYALMEPAAKEGSSKKGEGRLSVCTVQMDLQWLDVGSWPSFMETVAADKAGNGAAGEGTVVLHSCRNSLAIASKGHTLAMLGVDDLIVVHTPDATLVMPKSKAEELKALHGLLEEGLR